MCVSVRVTCGQQPPTSIVHNLDQCPDAQHARSLDWDIGYTQRPHTICITRPPITCGAPWRACGARWGTKARIRVAIHAGPTTTHPPLIVRRAHMRHCMPHGCQLMLPLHSRVVAGWLAIGVVRSTRMRHTAPIGNGQPMWDGYICWGGVWFAYYECAHSCDMGMDLCGCVVGHWVPNTTCACE